MTLNLDIAVGGEIFEDYSRPVTRVNNLKITVEVSSLPVGDQRAVIYGPSLVPGPPRDSASGAIKGREKQVIIGDLNFVSILPKTRSGKIMRRVFKAIVLDQDPGDITTIEDEGSVEEARRAWEAMREEISTG